MYTFPLAHWAVFIFAMIQSLYGYQAYNAETDTNFDMKFGSWSAAALFVAGIGIFVDEFYGFSAAVIIAAVSLAFYVRRFLKTRIFRTVGICAILSAFFLWTYVQGWQQF